MTKIKPIAIHLPQFHPIPENDAWWGKGFTEWTNVTKAQPRFEGHYQPHLPADLGFYDLRLEEARLAQEALAKQYGIYGFCYYHYWFNGKRVLNEPLDRKLQNPKEDFPFMLCWANENWTRAWDGKDNDVLLKQSYSPEDDLAHMRWLCSNVFSDSRYIKVGNKPVFAIYRQELFPDIKKTIHSWRQIAKEEFGFDDLYLCVMESFNQHVNPNDYGFDAAIEFSAHQVIRNKVEVKRKRFSLMKHNGETIDYRDFELGVAQAIARTLPDYKLYRSVTPSWDNSARKGSKGIVAVGSSPELYESWLYKVATGFKAYSNDENFLFINAWNEWAEGNHLEPCTKYGHAYLEATKKVLHKIEG
ncbi:glycoside hydrolase family 99-like domain-containing protein [Flavobacterium chuncheonense]|uniref:Glycoside hydrolase family 99-like domain-containing protein n=1 Tax=Flavobacterium chuncheonense TaxID=2026653 RepID=A0ABW5YK78_9FLAO